MIKRSAQLSKEIAQNFKESVRGLQNVYPDIGFWGASLNSIGRAGSQGNGLSPRSDTFPPNRSRDTKPEPYQSAVAGYYSIQTAHRCFSRRITKHTRPNHRTSVTDLATPNSG